MMLTLGIDWMIWAATLVEEGQTPAKKMLGLRVINLATSQPAKGGTMLLLRGLVGGFVAYFAFPLSLGVLVFMPFWDRQNQNIYDKVSGTIVVMDPFGG